MKKEIRVLGIDDASFSKFRDKRVKVIGAFFRGGDYIDGVLSTTSKVDGSDSTANIVRMINRSRFKPQLQAVVLDGIAVGGFNIIDIDELYKKTKVPVVVVIRKYPDFRRIFSVLEKLGMQSKIKLIEKAGKPEKFGKIYIQSAGIGHHDLKHILKITCTHSYIPEPIRVAHIIGQGISMGESKGNA